MAAGVAIDTARVNQAKTVFAAAVDAAALAVAADARSDLSNLTAAAKTARLAELKTYARTYITKNYTPEYRNDTAILINLDVTDTNVTLNASHDYPMTFMSIAGINSTRLNVKSEITKNGNSIEVALMLDNTGSMSGSRIASLKQAATDFVNIAVWPNQTPYYSKVAIVPYSMGVNVGATYAVAARGAVANGTSTSPGSANYTYTYDRSSCSNNSGNCSGTTKTVASSNCVSERTGAQAYTDAAVATYKVGRNYPPSGNPCLTGTVLPLTSNKTSLIAAINAMTASGSSAGQVGVAWGWYTLSPTFGLFTGTSAPAAYGTNHLKKVAILWDPLESTCRHASLSIL